MNDRTTIEIVRYDPAWPQIFRAERLAIERALGTAVERIAHIGSTAVPGLAAKPIVDVQVEVRSLASRGFYDAKLKPLGYVSIDSEENDLRIAMRKRGEIAANLHIVIAGSWAAQRTLLLRDALREDSELAGEYAGLKRRNAGSHESLEAYTRAKTAFVERAIAARAGVIGVPYTPGNRR